MDQPVREAQQEVAHTRADTRTICLVILTVLAVLAALSVAADIVLPLLLALLFNLVLTPLKRALTDRLRLPASLAAVLLIALLFGVMAMVGFAISVPAADWIAKAPEGLPTLAQRLAFLRGPIGFLQHGWDQLQHLMQSRSGGGPGQQPVAVQQGPGLGGIGLSVLQGTRIALGQVLTLVVVLFFLLTAGDSLLRRIVEIAPTFGDKRRLVEITEEIERNISGYLLVITVMNLLVGTANGLSMWALGMPDPLLWGTLAFLLNYIPLLGPLTGIVTFFFVGLFSSPALIWALAPPGIYFVIHVLEGETITPMLLARRLTLNPVLVIVSLFFWDWMWGVIGMLLAVPLLAIAKIVCDHVPALTPIGHILGGSEKNRRAA